MSGTKGLLALIASALVISSAAALAGCPGENSGSSPAVVCASAQPGSTPIDTDLMAYLSAARSLHHEANMREDSGDVAGAIAAMSRLVGMRAPRQDQQLPEVEEVLADAYARMAELRLKSDDVDGALKDVDLGLAHAKTPTYFRGHLVEVQGIAYEARFRALRAAGKNEEAAKAKAQALTLLADAVRIQEQVIQQTLGDGGAEGGAR